MASLRIARLLLIAIVALATALIPVMPSYAQEGCAEGAFCLPAGIACDFDLQIEFGAGGANHVYREFYDRDGNLVRWFDAGKGTALTFTNLLTGDTLSTKPNGAVARNTPNSDGTTTSVLTGHWIMILFPGDTPPGPSTTLYVGRVVSTTSVDGVTTLQETSGTATDICAALSD